MYVLLPFFEVGRISAHVAGHMDDTLSLHDICVKVVSPDMAFRQGSIPEKRSCQDQCAQRYQGDFRRTSNRCEREIYHDDLVPDDGEIPLRYYSHVGLASLFNVYGAPGKQHAGKG